MDPLAEPESARWEPCGLVQMEAMRLGTLPIVAPTGGLKDTVEERCVGHGHHGGVELQSVCDHRIYMDLS